MLIHDNLFSWLNAVSVIMVIKWIDVLNEKKNFSITYLLTYVYSPLIWMRKNKNILMSNTYTTDGFFHWYVQSFVYGFTSTDITIFWFWHNKQNIILYNILTLKNDKKENLISVYLLLFSTELLSCISNY